MRFKVLFALAAVACVPGAVQAQSSSLFGNRGVSAGSGTLANGVGGGNANSSQQQGVTGFLGTGAGSLNGFASGAQSQSAGGLAGTGAGTFVGNRNSAASAQGANGQAGGMAGPGPMAGGRRWAASIEITPLGSAIAETLPTTRPTLRSCVRCRKSASHSPSQTPRTSPVPWAPRFPECRVRES